jgi:multimeric flavodoxin WrbA
VKEKSQKVVGISASPKNGFTDFYVKDALNRITSKFGVHTQFISLAGLTVNSCDGCMACAKNELKRLCKFNDDWYDVALELAYSPPMGLIIGSPVYVFNVNSLLLAFLERFTVFHQMIYHPDVYSREAPDWSRTAAAALSVGGARNGGQEFTIDTILHWYLIHGFTVVGCAPMTAIGVSCYEKTGSLTVSDERGLRLIEIMANRVVWTGLALQKSEPFERLPYGRERPAALETTDREDLRILEENVRK